MSGLTWQAVSSWSVDSLRPCGFASAHPLLTSPGENWPCDVVYARSIGLDFPLTGEEAPEGQDLLIGVGMRDPTRLTADMLRLDDMLWPNAQGRPPPRVHLFVRPASFLHLVLRGMRRLLNAGLVERIEFDLPPWGLRSMSTTPGRVLGTVGSVGFGIYSRSTDKAEFQNYSAVGRLAECEGGMLPTKVQARRRPDLPMVDVEAVAPPHNAFDACCWIPFFRGRGTRVVWEACCAPESAIEIEECSKRLPPLRSLQSCCGPGNPLAALARYSGAVKPMIDSRLRSAVRNLSISVESLYERRGAKPTMRHYGSETLSLSLEGVNEFSISSSDTELFTWLRNDVLRAGPSSTWSRWPIFVLGNAFGYSTFILALLFRGAAIDVLDAELDAGVRDIGSPLTRRIAQEEGLDIQLHAGYSPGDIPRAVRTNRYGLVFLDGEHTPSQLELDFAGIHPFLAPRTLVVCHDIALHDMHEAVRNIMMSEIGSEFSYRLYPSKNYVNEQGTGFFYRGFSEDEFRNV